MSQIERILKMYSRLQKGHVLNKAEQAVHFNVTEKTIQRDFDSIRSFLEKDVPNEYLDYDREQKGYKLQQGNNTHLHNEEVLAIVKILIESRAFPKSDMHRLIDKLTVLASPANQDFIKKLMRNEKHLYVDLQHRKPLFSLIWKLSEAVHTKRIINICYQKENEQNAGERTLKPVGILFSEYYFYLLAYQTTRELSFPTIYRIDRITSCNVTNEHFKTPYRFEEGEFRKRVQFMHAGELINVKFRFTGASSQAVLDRLPTAKIVGRDENSVTFEAEVFGAGIKMWLQSQGENVEVLSSEHLKR
ncbi:helix-turn-helix transcriptional regulator [Domibacillus aminovorans]|uniref:WYL domain-containing protein n=1 Tax=Domibacillus aminovorans TaxID=29332 RepID=A0A177L795_9BACI|nr:WYL domain-containing protein [Domibacillus aminovorans]OAH61610.1 hypothetical protein AWH49_11715 [Domibacillus aminovorans]